MKGHISTLFGAISLFAVSAAAFNFDDHDRALQRAEDMTDSSPLTNEEVNKIKSMVDNGQLKVRSKVQPKKLAEAEPEASSQFRRVLQKSSKKGEPMRPSAERFAPPSGMERGAPPQYQTVRGGGPKNSGPPKMSDPARNPGRNDPRPSTARSSPQGRDESSQSNMVQSTSRHHNNHDGYWMDDDDWMKTQAQWAGDDSSFQDPLFYTEMYMEGFQDSRGVLGGIPPNPSLPDEFDAGAMYLFNGEPIFPLDFSQPGQGTSFGRIDTTFAVANVTGQCVRTDPHDELDPSYAGLAYCHFVYLFPDDIDEFVAEGPVRIGADAILSVTGGQGLFRRTVGSVELSPVDPDALPDLVPSSIQDLPASYYMRAYLNVNGASSAFLDF